MIPQIKPLLTATLLAEYAMDKSIHVQHVKPKKWNGKNWVPIKSKITPTTQKLAQQYSFRNILKRVTK